MMFFSKNNSEVDGAIKLSIIILNWNTRELLRGCLAAILRASFDFVVEIIVVDNASTDGSVDAISAEFPNVRLIKNKMNEGFAKANNRALNIARGEYLLLMNSDTIVRDGSVFNRWVTFMDSEPSIGASGPRLIFPDGHHQVGDAGFKPTLYSVFNYAFFISKIAPMFKGLFLNCDRIPKNPIDVDWISGAALLVRASVAKMVGYLNEDHFMFAEDIEWGCRIKSFRYRVVYLPFLEIIHLQGQSIKQRERDESFKFMWMHNLRRLYTVYNPQWQLVLYDCMMNCGFLLRAAVFYIIFVIKRDAVYKNKSQKMLACFCEGVRNTNRVIGGRGSA